MLRLQYTENETIHVYRGKGKGFGPLAESTPALYESQSTAIGAKGAIMRGWARTGNPLARHEIAIVTHPDGQPPRRWTVRESHRAEETAPCCEADHQRAMAVRRQRLGRL